MGVRIGRFTEAIRSSCDQGAGPAPRIVTAIARRPKENPIAVGGDECQFTRYGLQRLICGVALMPRRFLTFLASSLHSSISGRSLGYGVGRHPAFLGIRNCSGAAAPTRRGDGEGKG